ncbi:MAG TPA: GNAT family N-acetyltransferase [Bryobacteraceae bacterium]|nr:GNAT family N-acetyltransferase [Bryobacteraceae bacterium]
MTQIVPAATAAQVDEVRKLFEEYWISFGFTPCFQHFDEELAGLPGEYVPPNGRLGIAKVEGITAGCVALRRFDAERCEMKRLYVRPGFRGRGLGDLLLDWILAEARRAGYREVVADTMPVMTTALALYDWRGFERTGPYAADATPGAVYLRLVL